MEEETIISMVSEIRLVKQAAAAGGQVATKCFWHKNIKIPFLLDSKNTMQCKNKILWERIILLLNIKIGLIKWSHCSE